MAKLTLASSFIWSATVDGKKPTREQIASVRNPVESGYAVITMPYTSIIVPHAAGVELLAALEHAEVGNDMEYGNPTITPLIQSSSPTIKTISRKYYADVKMAELLGMEYKDFIAPKEEEPPF